MKNLSSKFKHENKTVIPFSQVLFKSIASISQPLSLPLLIMSLSLMGAGCGKQAYVIVNSSTAQQAPGTYSIQPKVDILLAEDDSGSMYDIFNEVKDQLPAFLDGLASKGWDYHFAVTTLTHARTLTQALASKQDANWGTSWISPYPGALPFSSGTLSSSVFKKPSNFTGFLTTSDISNASNGSENGLESIASTLESSAATNTGFLRNDAMLVIIGMSNGEDTSGITMCRRSDGLMVACEYVDSSKATAESSFLSLKARILAKKNHDANKVRFYAAVSTLNRSSCLSHKAYAGLRYQRMATELGGTVNDICSNNVSNILSEIGANLTDTTLAFETHYLFIAADADPSSIQVTKYIDGSSSNAVTLPQSDTDGWTYAGKVNNVYAIDYPTQMRLSSGYAIELHGSAKLKGNDTADVNFKPAGAKNSASQ